MGSDPNTRNRWASVIPLILTIGILAVLLISIDPQALGTELLNADVPFLIFTILFLILPFGLMGWRWKLMVEQYAPIGFLESTKLFFVCQSLNVITPSKLGDLAKAYFLRSERFQLRTGTSAALFEKLIDLFGIMVFAGIGIIFLQVGTEWTVAVTLSFAAATIALILLFTLDFSPGGIGGRLVSFFLPGKRLEGFKALILDMLDYFQTIRKRPMSLFMVFSLTLLSWFTHLVQGWMLFIALNMPIDFFVAVGLIPFGILAGMLPITIAGIGTRETAFLVVFAAYASPAAILLFGLLFSLRYALSALVGLVWLPKYLKRETDGFKGLARISSQMFSKGRTR